MFLQEHIVITTMEYQNNSNRGCPTRRAFRRVGCCAAGDSRSGNNTSGRVRSHPERSWFSGGANDLSATAADGGKGWATRHYLHQNPVRRGLVLEPQQWPWSSARDWLTDEAGPVLENEVLRAEMKLRPIG